MYVPLLARMNLASELDAQPLGRYCRYVVEWIAADEAIRREGTWFNAVGTNMEPTKKQHPAFKAWQALERVLSDIESSFGMRPDSRFKILRDQAAALGGLPLWEANREAAMPDASPPSPAASGDDDPIGLLARMDAPPPGTLPN